MEDRLVGLMIIWSGDTDSFTINLDAGQTATVQLNVSDPSILGQIDLIAPDTTSLGITTAALTGDRVLLQSVSIVQAGTYTIDVTALAGAGNYEVVLTLNAAIEEETITGISNDTIATAQFIDSSAVDLSGTAEHLGIQGQLSITSDADFYSLTLGANELNSFLAGGSDVVLELYNDTGILLAVSDANNDESYAAISGFQSQAGTYTLGVSTANGTPADYTVAVVRDGLFGITPGDGSPSGTAFPLLEAGTVLGHVAGGFSVGGTDRQFHRFP